MWSTTKRCSGNCRATCTADGEVELAELAEAAEELRLEHEVRGLALHDMAHAGELLVLRQRREVFLHAFSLQIHPADDPFDERMLVREFQEPARFFHFRACLHRDAAVDVNFGRFAFKVSRQPVALERCAFANPRILGLAVFPEVLVGIDAHGIKPPPSP
jgi:hypothetical protein